MQLTNLVWSSVAAQSTNSPSASVRKFVGSCIQYFLIVSSELKQVSELLPGWVALQNGYVVGISATHFCLSMPIYNCRASSANTAIQKNVKSITSPNIFRDLINALTMVRKPVDRQHFKHKM